MSAVAMNHFKPGQLTPPRGRGCLLQAPSDLVRLTLTDQFTARPVSQSVCPFPNTPDNNTGPSQLLFFPHLPTKPRTGRPRNYPQLFPSHLNDNLNINLDDPPDNNLSNGLYASADARLVGPGPIRAVRKVTLPTACYSVPQNRPRD